jgi:hypothetical protein
MRIDYCDICGQPIKGNDFWTLYMTHDTHKAQEASDFYNDYQNYLKKLEKETKDICPSCKLLIDEIFKLRLQNLNQINLELLGIYDLPSYNKKDKKNGKEKKK